MRGICAGALVGSRHGPLTRFGIGRCDIPKGVEKQALANSGDAQGKATQYGDNASATYNTLAPALTSEALNPQGYSPTDLAAMNTAGQQSAGGSMSGAVGQGALLAARTNNAGTADAAIGQSARTAQQNLGSQAVETQANNAALKQKQQQAGLSGLEGLHSDEQAGALGALGTSNQALGVGLNAAQANPWTKTILPWALNAVRPTPGVDG